MHVIVTPREYAVDAGTRGESIRAGRSDIPIRNSSLTSVVSSSIHTRYTGDTFSKFKFA